MLRIDALTVHVGAKLVAQVENLGIQSGEVVVLMGANGSGKTTLAQALLGNPHYTVKGRAQLATHDLLSLSIHERARAGLYVTWQNPVAIPGVSVFQLCKAAVDAHGITIPSVVALRDQLQALATRVGLPPAIIERNVHEGMSGGERKRLELMQLLLLKPKVAILDEIDSGLDVDGLKMVGTVIQELAAHGTACLVITHYSRLLAHIPVSRVWVLGHGRLLRTGGQELVDEIERTGFTSLVK
jgi:Fe-S cluster assembly ATP-binding protein